MWDKMTKGRTSRSSQGVAQPPASADVQADVVLTVHESAPHDKAVVAAAAENAVCENVLQAELNEAEEEQTVQCARIEWIEKIEMESNATLNAQIQRDAQRRLEVKQAEAQAKAHEADIASVRKEIADAQGKLATARLRIEQLDE